MRERRGGDAHMTSHKWRGYENAEIWKTKGRKKAENKKKRKGGERGKRKGGTPGLGHQVNN
jgi:hypothetical protein